MNNFNDIFNKNYDFKGSAHARVNLIGEHTDYTGGYVLPMLLKYKTDVYISQNKNRNIVYSALYNETKSFSNLYKSRNNHWSDYIKGCIFFINSNFKLPKNYFNIYIKSNIPINRGISSSSALCVSFLKTLNNYYNLNIDNKNLALLAQKVERNYIGVRGGIMDQMISSVGILNKAFFLNCNTLEYELINLSNDYLFCLVDSEVQRNLRDSQYNKRYEELKESEKILKVKLLASTNIKNLNKTHFKNSVIKKRARHVISENARVLKSKIALENYDMIQFGKLMNESHKSYADDFEASNDEVDTMVKRSLNSGAIGSRLTGGGFGGFTVSLVRQNNYNQWKSNMLKFYDEDNFLK